MRKLVVFNSGTMRVATGRGMFDGLKEKFNMKLTKTRASRTGNVLLCYQPVA